ncbi:hypothetical protein TRFO_26901 [Tritrichomonas foetus]|uniref:Uncharacterized protein n=1 Tax=Tritrichomonas foetus TaxID=1144522 RepID=A0A1J4K6S3_9EUKA|nr:hypothetical protein TRFO_26901 [Tritrichomonas foetus]|eukprot:OHT05414.1 hypothetical protein TRFO_26901 [Tritrichomonas foetus]
MIDYKSADCQLKKSNRVINEHSANMSSRFSKTDAFNCDELLHLCQLMMNSTNSENVVELINIIRKSYAKFQDENLLNIFDELNIFRFIITNAYLEDALVSSSSILFIVSFTATNENLAQLFIENGLFYLISEILQEKHVHSNILVKDAISIIVNLSCFCDTYIKRAWRVFTPNLFFEQISSKNFEIIKICAKFAANSLQLCTIESIIEVSLNGLYKILELNNPEISIIALHGLSKYLDSPCFNKLLFTKINLQKSIEIIFPLISNNQSLSTENLNDNLHNELNNKFNCDLNNRLNKLNGYDNLFIQACLVIGKMNQKKCITEFSTEQLFPLLDCNRPKLQEIAFWCLKCALVQNSIIDFPKLIDFLLGICKDKLHQATFNVLVYEADALLSILPKVEYKIFKQFVENGIIELFVKFLLIENFQIQKDTLRVMSNFCSIAAAHNESENIKKLFIQAEGVETLRELIDRNCDSQIDKAIFKFIEMIDIKL